MKKIMHFLPDNHAWGGIEVYLQHTLSLLQQRGRYELVAAVTQGGRLAKQLKESNIAVCELPKHIHMPIVRALDFRVLKTFLGCLKKEQPDLVHVHKGRIEQSLICHAGFPLVYTYHSYGGPNNLENAPNPFIRMLYASTRPLLRSLTPYLSGMAVVSQYERQRLYREGFLPENFQTEVLYNGLPTESMLKSVVGVDRLKLRQELGIPPEHLHNARLVLFPCRLTPDKNASAFLRLAKQAIEDPRRQRPVYFIVAGDGTMASEFEQAFRDDPVLSSYGRFLGFRGDVPQLIYASDLTVSLSLQEGFGLRVLESLVFGRPCVTYAAGGITEVMSLPQASQWLIPTGNETEFLTRLIETINLPDETLNDLAPVLQQHAKRFDISRHVDGLENFYQRVFEKITVPERSVHFPRYPKVSTIGTA